jgi:hypothetical protein
MLAITGKRLPATVEFAVAVCVTPGRVGDEAIGYGGIFSLAGGT